MEPMTATRQPRLTPPIVTEISLPPDARALSALARIDYEDAFRVTGAGRLTPEQWVSAILRDAPPRVRRRLVIGWTALGLRLGPPWSPDRVLGWKIEHSGSDFVLLAADSWLGLRGRLLFRTEGDGLLFATLVEQTNPIGRAVWAVITPRHRRVVTSLLNHAAGASGGREASRRR
jgi:hypothetical protein